MAPTASSKIDLCRDAALRSQTMSVVTNVSPLAYSVPEAAEAIRVSPNLIRRMIRDGALAAARVGNRVLVRREDLARLLESKQ